MTHREELWNKAYKKLFELYGNKYLLIFKYPD